MRAGLNGSSSGAALTVSVPLPANMLERSRCPILPAPSQASHQKSATEDTVMSGTGPYFSPRFWKSGVSALSREGLCIDSPRAPKGRPNPAQAIGLGLQIASRPSPEGALHKTDVLPVGGDEPGIRERFPASIGTPLQGLAHSLILETQAVGLGWVSAPRWGLQIPRREP